MYSKLFLLFFIILILSSCASYRAPQADYYPSSSPSSRTADYSRKGEYYTVKKGDSLWKISKMYGIGVKELSRENNISSPKNLKIGQEIFIPYRYIKKSKHVFVWPVDGDIISSFGKNTNNVINKGLNIKTNHESNVKAAASGKVIFHNHLKGWGETIIIEHPSDLYSIYANLKNITVKENCRVKKGQIIGRVAPDKNNKNCILHFEIRKQHVPQNPIKYLR